MRGMAQNQNQAAQQGVHPANTLGLDYRAEAETFGYRGPILDVHTHIGTVAIGRVGVYGFLDRYSRPRHEKFIIIYRLRCDDGLGVLRRGRGRLLPTALG